MKFAQVAQLFDELEIISSRLEMTELLSRIFKQTTAQEAQIISYLSLGELKPPYIGTKFQLAEKNLTKVVARLLGSSEEQVKQQMQHYGDLGSVVMLGSWQTAQEPTLVDVYQALEAIEQVHGTGAQERKLELVYTLLSHLNQVGAKYVIRILIGALRLGFSDMTVIDALSWMLVGNKSVRGVVEDAYNICADIGRIAFVAKEHGLEGLRAMRIVVGIPIRPAAAERMPTAAAIIEKLGSCVAQPKLDGFRLQIHLDKTQNPALIKFFSRNLIDMSAMFPDIVHALQTLPVDTLICEGEAIAYDPNTGHFVPFQETVKRKRKHGIEQLAEDLPLQVFIFDVLYLNGENLMGLTHEQRRQKTEELFKGYANLTLKAIDEVFVQTPRELEHYFLTNIETGLEGVVVKKRDSIYQPGKRNFNWIKLKRQEEGHLDDTIDCVVLGYYYGQGKRAQFGIGAFLVGLYNKERDLFQTVAKIGTGLTDEEWIDLKKQCDTRKAAECPHNVECAKELFPDVWTYPEIVVQVRADEITISPLHTAGKTAEHAGYALRFPRIMGYRPDKAATDATTIDELKTLFNEQR